MWAEEKDYYRNLAVRHDREYSVSLELSYISELVSIQVGF